MSALNVFKARAPRTLKLQKPAPRRLATPDSETNKVMDNFLQQSTKVMNGCPESTVGSIHTEMQTDPRRTVNSVEVTDNWKEESHTSEQMSESNNNCVGRKVKRTAKLTKPRPLRQNSVPTPTTEAGSDILSEDEIERQTATFIQKLPDGSMSLAEIVAFRNMLIKNNVVLQNVGYDIFSLCYGIIQEVLKEEENLKRKELLCELLSLKKLDDSQKSALMETKERQRRSSVEYQKYCDLNSMAVLHDSSREVNNNEPDFCEPCQRHRHNSGRSWNSSVSSDKTQSTNIALDAMNQNLHSTASYMTRDGQKNQCGRKDIGNTNEPKICAVDSNDNNVISCMRRSSETLLNVIHQRDLHINDVIVDPRNSARKNSLVLRSISQNHEEAEHGDSVAKKDLMPFFSSQESRDSGLGDEAVLWDAEKSVIDELKRAALGTEVDHGIGDDEVLWEDEDTVLEDLKNSVSKDMCIRYNVNDSAKMTTNNNDKVLTTNVTGAKNSWATWNHPQKTTENSTDSGAWTSWRSRKDSFESHESLDTPAFPSRRNSFDSCDSVNDFTKTKAGNAVVKDLWNNVNKNVKISNGKEVEHHVMRQTKFDGDINKTDSVAFNKPYNATNCSKLDMQHKTENLTCSAPHAQKSTSVVPEREDLQTGEKGSETTSKSAISGFGTQAKLTTAGFGTQAKLATAGFGTQAKLTTAGFGTQAAGEFRTPAKQTAGGFGMQNLQMARGFGTPAQITTGGFGTPAQPNAGGFGTAAQPIFKKPHPPTRYQSGDNVKNWRESCSTKPKFLMKLTDAEMAKLCNEVIRQPIGPGFSSCVIAKIEATLPDGMCTAKGRRKMFEKYRKLVLGEDKDQDNSPPPSYTREDLLALADSPLSKIMPEEFSYLSKIFPEVCPMEPPVYWSGTCV
ncbi:hypothetical protein FSP39_004652 [Pinctada imbricata]|uniref:Uncharacterized protein n=1 Tax=Pinctada imbricata TaxID=66713 RepID=A0AA88XJH2_PINIB|nr:hypothetical protein FSP39_004652 [Pinctada imbricata]